MQLGFFLTWAIHQVFGTAKGDLIISLLTGPLGALINTASHDKAQAIVTEINGIAATGVASINAAASIPPSGS